MKTLLKLAAIAVVIAVQPVFAEPSRNLPDVGATSLLTVIALGGLMIAKNIVKR